VEDILNRILAAVLGFGMLAAVIALLPTGANQASAHEVRQVDEYTFVVGFLAEPAYLNQPNGLDLYIYTVPEGVNPEEATEEQQTGIEGLEETLEAEISYGGSDPMPLTLEAAWDTPGGYHGHMIPTAAGDYTFHIFGAIEGAEVDESFTSSPEGFNAVDDPAALQYPEQVPSNQELQASVQAAGTGEDDSDNSGTAIVLAIVGIVVGGAGLLAGGYAVVSRGR
jgi:hypothetical protein